MCRLRFVDEISSPRRGASRTTKGGKAVTMDDVQTGTCSDDGLAGAPPRRQPLSP